MKKQFPPEWRTQTRWKRRFYARYMTWLERIGYAVVTLVISALIVAFNYRVDDMVSSDKVPITAAVTSMKAAQRTLVVRQLVPNFTDVGINEPILEVVEGENEIDRYLAWQALQKLGPTDFARPRVITLGAAAAGALVVDEQSVARPVDADAEIAQIRNYRDLRMHPTFTGQGVANAVAGGVASLRAIVVEPAAGVLLRGNESGKALVSGQLLSQATKDEVQTRLANASLVVRDDLPLQLLELVDLQVDADLALVDDAPGATTFLEPPASVALKADVLKGNHVATIQFAKLPPQLQKEVDALLKKAIEQQVVTAMDGKPRRISQATNLNSVFKVKAAPGKTATPIPAITGTAISRGFEAELAIQSPPAYLMHAVRQADQAGRTVTARVELKTGDRVIATLLLKRS